MLAVINLETRGEYKNSYLLLGQLENLNCKNIGKKSKKKKAKTSDIKNKSGLSFSCSILHSYCTSYFLKQLLQLWVRCSDSTV